MTALVPFHLDLILDYLMMHKEVTILLKTGSHQNCAPVLNMCAFSQQHYIRV
jgi:hypothetical protein